MSTTPPGARRTVGRAAVPVRVPQSPTGYVPPPVTGPPALVARRRWWPRRLLTFALVLLVLVAAAGVGGWFYLDGLSRNMSRVEAFTPIAGPRPDKPVPATRNLLILGSDSRDPGGITEGRADTIMLLHLPADRRQAYLISLPRDLWVSIPATPDGSAGGHEAKLNAATAFGGVPLMVRTVEDYTGVRLDHVVLLDFAGFVEVTDAVGGVDLHIEQTIQSIHGDKRVFEQGRQHLSGEEALDYIRQRYQFADGDFTRMRNQQQFLRSLLDRAASREVLADPRKLDAFLRTLTATLTVDEDFSLARVGWAVRHLRGDRLTFLTSPHAGTGSAGGQSVVLSDDEGAAELYAAVRQDRVADWVQTHPDRLSGT